MLASRSLRLQRLRNARPVPAKSKADPVGGKENPMNDTQAAQETGNLIWIDLEMTGLDTLRDQIIEIATIVTNRDLEEIAVGPVLAIHQPAAVMEGMDEWNTRQHGRSGLTERVLDSNVDLDQAQKATIDFLEQHVVEGTSPMCGNSICQDRRFLARQMPALESFFHYRNLDVSTLKILAQSWAPAMAAEFEKDSGHRALDDIRDSIAELRFYRQRFLNPAVIRTAE